LYLNNLINLSSNFLLEKKTLKLPGKMPHLTLLVVALFISPPTHCRPARHPAKQ